MSVRKSPLKMPVIVAVLVIAVMGLVRHFHIKNFHRVVPGVLYTSGQPRGMDYTRLLYKYHIMTFVNVRQADEQREANWYNEEKAWVLKNGVNYVEMPIERGERVDWFPSAVQQAEFLELMADENNLPVLIHGSSGKKRAAILAAVWLMKEKGYHIDEVAKIVERINERPVSDVEMRFLGSLTK